MTRWWLLRSIMPNRGLDKSRASVKYGIETLGFCPQGSRLRSGALFVWRRDGRAAYYGVHRGWPRPWLCGWVFPWRGLRHMMFLAGLITGLVIAAFAVMAFAYSFAREWAE